MVGVSSVVRNFYPKFLPYFILLLGNILLWCIVLDSTGKTDHLLYLSVFFNLFCFFTGILLVLLEKKKRISSII